MKRIVLLRHSKSSWRHEGLPDEFRPLNERGYKEAMEVGKHLKRIGFKTDIIVSSPSVRTYSTAIILARTLKLKVSHISLDDRLYETGIKEHVRVISAQADSVDNIVFVGHNDTISLLAAYLSGEVGFVLSTSGFVLLELPSTSWKTIKKASGTIRLRSEDSGIIVNGK